jgi:hypothetical protein
MYVPHRPLPTFPSNCRFGNIPEALISRNIAECHFFGLNAILIQDFTKKSIKTCQGRQLRSWATSGSEHNGQMLEFGQASHIRSDKVCKEESMWKLNTQHGSWLAGVGFVGGFGVGLGLSSNRGKLT